mgnify:CR=1 FL=1
MKWDISFEVKSVRPLETLVRVYTNAEYEVSVFDKFFGREPFALAEHIVRDHIIPYVKYYFKSSDTGQLDITPTLIYTEEGVLSEVIPRALKNVDEIQYGVIIIEGEGVRGKVLVKNGKLERVSVNYNESIISGQDALLQLLSIPNKSRVTLYSLDLDTAVMALLERIREERPVRVENFNDK